MTALPDVLDEAARARVRRCTQPRWTEPMLAVLVDEPFSDPDWIYERKLDGVRCLVFARKGHVTLRSRSRRVLDDTCPELVDALRGGLPGDLVADGEIVAYEGRVTSFARLQARIGIEDADKARRQGVAVHLHLFDLLHLHGHDVTQVPQRGRKALLRAAIDFEALGRRVRYVPHRNEHGKAWLQEACEKGWEGLIAKRAEAPYHHGRSKDWRKLKCAMRQELVVVGFTEPGGSREDLGALVLGYHEEGALCYAGRVGTGFDADDRSSLRERLEGLERDSPPLDEEVPGRERDTRWVRPEIVVEVAFTEWTKDGRLRHPRYVGRREDKDAKDVVRERPQDR